MLALDSLIIDLIFQADAELDPDALVEALGGPELAETRKIVDVDMQDPRFEMELSPSMPFRRRGERRILIIDDSVAPMRADPRTDFLIPLDLREERQRLITACATSPIRLGRISALGSFGDAVIVARSAQDLRAVALLTWALDPTIDVDGRRRATPLNQTEFQAKLAAYDKRVSELGEKEILGSLGSATFARYGELLVVDVLGPDGSWDVRESYALEDSLAALDRFSLIPGAPASASAAPGSSDHRGRRADSEPNPDGSSKPVETPPEPAAEPEIDLPPLRVHEIDGRLVLYFPTERFDPTTAAALGKQDFNSLFQRSDQLTGQTRDRIHQDGAGFVTPLEFLSEVFVDGLPLTRTQLEQQATAIGKLPATRWLEVHCPRFGPAVLIDLGDRGRFLSSEIGAVELLVEQLPSWSENGK